MRDRLNRAQVTVAPSVLVQLVVVAAHDAPGDKVFYAAACCVASRFDGTHRRLIRALLQKCTMRRSCNVLRVAFNESELMVSCVDLRVTVIGESAEGLIWDPFSRAGSLLMYTSAEALSSQTNSRSLAWHLVA